MLRRGFRVCGRDKGGNGSRRMSAVAPLTSSQSPPMLLGFYRYKGDKKENNIILPVTLFPSPLP